MYKERKEEDKHMWIYLLVINSRQWQLYSISLSARKLHKKGEKTNDNEIGIGYL